MKFNLRVIWDLFFSGLAVQKRSQQGRNMLLKILCWVYHKEKRSGWKI